MTTKKLHRYMYLLGTFFVVLLGILSCSDSPYTGSMMQPGDLDKYLSHSGGKICLINGTESACVTLYPKRGDKLLPIIHIHPSSTTFLFYYKGEVIMRAEKPSDNTDLIDDLVGDGGPRDDMGGGQQPPGIIDGGGTDGSGIDDGTIGDGINGGDNNGGDPNNGGNNGGDPNNGGNNGGDPNNEGNNGGDPNNGGTNNGGDPNNGGINNGGINNGGDPNNGGNPNNGGTNNGNNNNGNNNGDTNNGNNNNGNNNGDTKNGNNNNGNNNGDTNNRNNNNGNNNGDTNNGNNNNGNNNGDTNNENNNNENNNNENNNGDTNNENNNGEGTNPNPNPNPNNPNPSGHNPPDNVQSHLVYGHADDDPAHRSGDGWIIWIFYPHNYVEQGHPRGTGMEPIHSQTGPASEDDPTTADYREDYGFTFTVTGGEVKNFSQTAGDCTDELIGSPPTPSNLNGEDNRSAGQDRRDDWEDTPCSASGNEYSTQMFVKSSTDSITITIRWSHGMYAGQTQIFKIMKEVSMREYDSNPAPDPGHTNQERWP